VNKNRLSVAAAILLTFSITLAIRIQAATYYVDSVNGDDYESGTSPQSAWKSMSKINSTTFQPGDNILLNAGSAWTGTDQTVRLTCDDTDGSGCSTVRYCVGSSSCSPPASEYDISSGTYNVAVLSLIHI